MKVRGRSYKGALSISLSLTVTTARLRTQNYSSSPMRTRDRHIGSDKTSINNHSLVMQRESQIKVRFRNVILTFFPMNSSAL